MADFYREIVARGDFSGGGFGNGTKNGPTAGERLTSLTDSELSTFTLSNEYETYYGPGRVPSKLTVERKGVSGVKGVHARVVQTTVVSGTV